jgi:hypothetical protein
MGLVVNPIMHVLLIRPSLRAFGDGGGGAGCAIAMLGTEIFVVSCMMGAVGRGAFDKRSLGTIGKSLLAYAVVALAHGAMAPIGPLRLVADGLLYLAIVLATGALRLKEMYTVAREAVQSRKGDHG